MKLAGRQIDRDVRSCAMVFVRSHELTALTASRMAKARSSKKRSLCSARGMKTLGGSRPRSGTKPAHQGLETHHFVRRQVHDGLGVHDRLTAAQRVTRFLNQRQLTDGLVMSFGIKNYVVAHAGARGLVERHVRVLDDFAAVGALLIPDHDPNAGVLIKLPR
jgi:hypothetical protein